MAGMMPPPGAARPVAPAQGFRPPAPGAAAPARPAAAPPTTAARPAPVVPSRPQPASAPAARKDPFGLGAAPPAAPRPPAPAAAAPVEDDWSDIDIGESSQARAPSLGLDAPARAGAAPIELPPGPETAPELAPMHAFVPPPAETGHQPAVATEGTGDGGEATLRDALSRASREVIERVVWEVVPELAETIIRENLDRLVNKPR
jgi:hypothetical protein